jgi:tetratricopeptide (TPR) repeat protein
VFLQAIAPAHAQQVDPREIQSRSDCLAGRFQAGADLLARMFAETGNANYIYNQGRCYEQNGKFDEAILRFREFLRTAKGLSAEEKAEVDGHITECQAELDKRLAPPPPLPPPASPPPPSPATGGDVATTQSRASTDGRGLRIAGIVSGSVGAAALVIGAIFGISARSIANDVAADDAQHRYDRSKDERGKLFSNLQWVGYGVGVAGIAAGGVLYYLGNRADHAPASGSVSFLPVLSPGGSGAVLQGRF